jgi:hypothetical protein
MGLDQLRWPAMGTGANSNGVKPNHMQGSSNPTNSSVHRNSSNDSNSNSNSNSNSSNVHRNSSNDSNSNSSNVVKHLKRGEVSHNNVGEVLLNVGEAVGVGEVVVHPTEVAQCSGL